MKKVETEKTTLYLGDCEEILPELPVVDALVTDPPYGINKDGQKKSSGNKVEENILILKGGIQSDQIKIFLIY